MDNNKEIWVDIEGYEGDYMISSWGRVKSLPRTCKTKSGIRRVGEVILRSWLTHDGYLRVGLWKENKVKFYTVHRLVAQAFLDNPNNLPEVNHIDEDKTNNHVENLEWCDNKYNMNYGTCIQRRAEKLSKPIIQLTLDGKVVQVWSSLSEVQRQLGWQSSHICQCANGKRKSAHGYKWRYVTD